ncbi:MAG: AAA family ATPase [Promethearchaeota archaeon]
MLITKIELENITTHKKTTIEFQEGLNLLYGKNGTGKSTVLNMIGYVLFDFLPVKKQKSLVRNSKDSRAKFGKIKIWIVGLHDDVYIIQRTLARSNPLIEVINARTKMVIPGINKASHLTEWMAQQLEIPQEIDLKKLFNTSIGVPQGTFTAPFLKTPRERTKFFNPILQVHVYKDVVWQKLHKIENLFDNDINNAEKKESRLEGELKPKEELLQKKNRLETKLNVCKEDLTNVKLQFEEVSKLFESLKQRSEDLNKYKNELKRLRSEEKIVSNNNIKLTKRFEKAKNANSICLETKEDFKQYESLLDKQQKLEEKNERFNNIKDIISELSNKVASINAKNSEIKRQIDEIIKNKANLSNLENDNNSYNLFKDLIREKREKLNNIRRDEEEFEELRRENIELNRKKIELEQQLKQLPELENKILEIENIEKTIHKLDLEIIKAETEIKKLHIDKNNSKGGMCPILNEKCLNIKDKNFNDIFQEKIRILESQLNPKKQELDRLKERCNEIGEKEEIKQKINALKKLQGQLDEIKKQVLEKGKRIKTYTEKISKKTKEARELKELETKIDELEPNVKAYNILINKVDNDLPRLNKEFRAHEEEKIPLIQKLVPLQEERDVLKEIPDKLINIKKELEPIRNNYNRYKENKKMAQELPEIEKELNDNKEHLNKIKKDLNIFEEKKKKLEETFDQEEFEKVQERLESVREKKVSLSTTIKETETLLENIAKEIQDLESIENDLMLIKDEIHTLKFMFTITSKLREFFDAASPKITEAIINSINLEASNHYRDIMDDPNVILRWDKDYQIYIKTSENEKEFPQLSGGEQMAAALAVRLAILKVISNAEFAFFDEPTMNLDTEKRENLAKIIQRIKGFKQFFVISHDDTFEENVDNVIKFSKNENEETTVEYLTQPDIELIFDEQ